MEDLEHSSFEEKKQLLLVILASKEQSEQQFSEGTSRGVQDVSSTTLEKSSGDSIVVQVNNLFN